MSVDLKNTKSGLAKLLAGENISIEHRKVKTASFSPVNRVLTLPIYKEEIEACVYDTFVAHEVGHALWSPVPDEELYKNKRLFRCINLVEDIRIERLIKSKFPGLVRSFYNGYQQLQKDNFFGVENIDIEELSFSDRLNLNAKISTDGFFNDEELALAEKAKKVLTFDEVISVAREILEYDKKVEEENESESESESEDKGEEGEGDETDGQETESDNGSSDEKSEKNESKKGSGSDESKGEEDTEGGSGDNQDNSDKNGSTEKSDITGNNSCADNHGEEKEEKESSPKKKKATGMKTDQSAEENLENFIDDKCADISYHDIVDFNIDSFIVPASKVAEDMDALFDGLTGVDDLAAEFMDFKSKNQAIVNYLHKEFEMKKNAEQHKRSSESTSGTLDVNKMFKYKYDENIFKKISIVPNGKSHGLVMLLDFSGSMDNKIMATIKQLINLVLFCKRAGIDFEVYAFSANSPEPTIPNYKNFKSEQIVLSNGFELLNLVSSKQNGMKFNNALLNLWRIGKVASGGFYVSSYYNDKVSSIKSRYSLNSTPLNSAVITIPKLVSKFRDTYSAQVVHVVVLTDGQATDSVCYSTGGNYTSGISNNARIKHGQKNFPVRYLGETATSYSGYSETIALLNYAKEVSGVSIVGFFLVNGQNDFFRSYETVNGPNGHSGYWNEKKEKQAVFSKEGSLTITNRGYDECYIIKSDKKSIGLESESPSTKAPIDVKTAIKEVRSGLKGVGNELKKQRIVLNKFISLISNPKNF